MSATLAATPRFRFAPVLDHELHVTEWGDPANPAIIMWHGLLRTGRDFDELAAALSIRFHVICPDTIGRGLSSWSADPMAEYSFDYYAGIATDLMDHYGLESAGWIGTSMGGLIGMRLASGPQADRLKWLIINDIGPEVPDEAIKRIVTYGAQMPRFASFGEAEAWFRAAYAPFGQNSDAFWARMARTSLRRCADGQLTPHYDPRIIEALTIPVQSGNDPWGRWARTTLSTHVIYGENSDLVSEALARRMAAEGPRPGLTKVADTGHAPTLCQPDMIARLNAIIDQLSGGA